MDMPSLKLSVCCSNELQINTRNRNVFCGEILSFPWWPKDQAKLKIFWTESLKEKKEWSYSTDKSVKYQLEPEIRTYRASLRWQQEELWDGQMPITPTFAYSITWSNNSRLVYLLFNKSKSKQLQPLSPPSLSAQCQIPGAFSVLTL